MARRHKPPESVHPNRWMVSYADLMTLLFAFFVVLYATTSVNTEKFQKMSQVLVGVFDQPSKVALPNNIKSLMSDLTQSFQESEPDYSPSNAFHIIEKLNILIEKTLPQKNIGLYNLDEAVQFTLASDELFIKSSQELTPNGEYFLTELAKALTQEDFFLYVEVLNDNQVDDTNPWLLGSGQMMSILQLLMLEQLSPTKMAGVAYGPYQPIATNNDEEGQGLNRRVNFVIYHNLQYFNRLKTLANKQKSAKPNK